MKENQEKKVDHKVGLTVLIGILVLFFGVPLVVYLLIAEEYSLGGYAACCVIIGLICFLARHIFYGFLK